MTAYNIVSYNIPAGGVQDYNANSDYLRVVEANQNSFELSVDGDNFGDIKVGQAVEFDKSFSKVKIKNTSGSSALIIKIAFLKGARMFDDTLVVANSLETKPAANSVETGQITVGINAVLIKAANTSRTGILINSGNADLYIGKDNTVTSLNGFLVPASGSISLENGGNIYAIRANSIATAYYAEEVE